MLLKLLLIVAVLMCVYVPVYKLLKKLCTYAETEMKGDSCRERLTKLKEEKQSLIEAVDKEKEEITRKAKEIKNIEGDLK